MLLGFDAQGVSAAELQLSSTVRQLGEICHIVNFHEMAIF